MPTLAQIPELSDEARFALDYAGSVTSGGLDPELLGIAQGLGEVDERLLVLNTLRTIATDRSAMELVERAIAAAEDAKYGNSLIEVSSLTEATTAARRVLQGKNPALVMRAGLLEESSEGAGNRIRELLSPLGDFAIDGQEQFPRAAMKNGSSSLHLDNFIYTPGRAGFRYTASAAEITSGNALFIAGLAHGRRALNTQQKREGVSHPYNEAVIALESDLRVQGLYDSARQGRPRTKEFVAHEGTYIVATVLNPGDVAFWPQGGPGSETPAWHALRQIGDEPRTSVSYHFIQQPNLPQPA